MSNYCGIDFGTSNSCAATTLGNDTVLVPVEQQHTTIPSAVFYSEEAPDPFLGRHAIDEYLAHEPGRLLRGLKSILGSSLIDETTRINRRSIRFRDIVGTLVGHLKHSVETHLNRDIDSVILGRPVHFVGAGEGVDEKAERALIEIATGAGFKHIEMLLEPIAAALEYEASVSREELVLIVDIGGGTADFSLVRVSPEGRQKADRKDDILANGGVAIGGTNFDQRLNLSQAMPFFGFTHKIRTEFGDELVEAPKSIFFDLATWHRIMFAYTPANAALARTMKRLALDKMPFDRLSMLIDERLAHFLAKAIEDRKIELTMSGTAFLDLSFIEAKLGKMISRAQFEASVVAEMDAIRKSLTGTISAAGIAPGDVATVFMTGGTCQIPVVTETVRTCLPHAHVTSGDMFGSVGRGLGLQAKRLYA